MIKKVNQILNTVTDSGSRARSGRRDLSKRRSAAKKSPAVTGLNERGSRTWIPFASYCTTGQFMDLEKGYKRHCSPTAAVNIVRTLQRGLENRRRPNESSEDMFLQFAEIGRRTRIYWNQDFLGHFGGTSNFFTGIFVRSCLRAAGLGRSVRVRFHPWITPDAIEKALEQGSIVLLQVYHHPTYKNHHMLCYACRETDTKGREFLLADGWKPGPLWVDDKTLGHGHFLTIRPV